MDKKTCSSAGILLSTFFGDLPAEGAESREDLPEEREGFADKDDRPDASAEERADVSAEVLRDSSVGALKDARANLFSNGLIGALRDCLTDVMEDALTVVLTDLLRDVDREALWVRLVRNACQFSSAIGSESSTGCFSSASMQKLWLNI